MKKLFILLFTGLSIASFAQTKVYKLPTVTAAISRDTLIIEKGDSMLNLATNKIGLNDVKN
jgi:hypothetical protein